MTERTFSIIKPDATRRNLTGKINAVIEDAGLRIVAQRRVKLSEEQAKAILELRLSRLTALGRDEIGDELKKIGEEIKEFLAILASRARIVDIVKKELLDIKAEFATPRRTEIVDIEGEVEVEISAADFDQLWDLAPGRRIDKTRYPVAAGGHTVEVDVYAGPLAGLVVAEVEFASREDAETFTPPAWCGDELTGDPSWSNASLAAHGRPE